MCHVTTVTKLSCGVGSDLRLPMRKCLSAYLAKLAAVGGIERPLNRMEIFVDGFLCESFLPTKVALFPTAHADRSL